MVPLVATSFTWARTWDGVDVNAHRAAAEVDAEIERLEGEGRVVEAFSVVSRERQRAIASDSEHPILRPVGLQDGRSGWELTPSDGILPRRA